MPDLITPGQGLLFMKVGTHANETLDSIITRKTQEIEDEGYAMWGYGGNTCHPRTMVQPFAESFQLRGGCIYLCMEEMNSRHFAEQIRAGYFSEDGLAWQSMPSGINVLGSRFALVIEDLRRDEFELPLASTRIAIGPSRGRPGDKYLKGQVDKACLEVVGDSTHPAVANSPTKRIGLKARLRPPYAVFLK
jgi:hypothetical protein